MTVHVVPEMLITEMTSEFSAMSATWICVGGVAEDDTAGNPVDDATVHVSCVPDAGAVVPPDETIVAGRFPKTSTAIRVLPPRYPRVTRRVMRPPRRQRQGGLRRR